MWKRNFTWTMILVLLPILACGLPGRDRGSEAPAPETPAAAAPAEPAATEPAAAEQPAAEPAQAEATTAAEPAQPSAAEESQQSAGSQPAQFTGVTSLDKLSSYRANFVMVFDGKSGDQPAKGEVKALLEQTKTPPARHLTMDMSGTITEETGGVNALEVYIIDDKVYMKNAMMGSDNWISFSGSDAAAFADGFFTPQEQLEVPDTAECDAQPVTVNGVQATHCTFNQKDMGSSDATFESGQGEAWVATEGNYIVKLSFKAEGYRPATPGEDGSFDFGSVSFDYNVTDINGDFTITLPEEAAQASDVGATGGGESGGGESGQAGGIPVYADAEDVANLGQFVTYSTPAAIEDVLAFYREEMTGAGWQENNDEGYSDDSTAMLSFTKEGKTFRLTVTTQDNKRAVIAAIE